MRTLPRRLCLRELLAAVYNFARAYSGRTESIISVCRLCVTVGVFAILASALGYVGSHSKKFFLTGYVFMGTIVATVQLILVFVMFVDAEGIVDRIEAYDLADGETWMTK